MSVRKEDLPRDLRGLIGGVILDPDGSERVLPFPVKAYFNLMEYATSLEHWLEDFDGSAEDREIYWRLLEGAKADLPELKRRILDHFEARPGIVGKPRASENVDHGAKSKVEKALADIEAGIYGHGNRSMTMKAVFRALAFCRKNGRMPTREDMMDEELIGMKFNVQQVTDAGKWLAGQNHPHPNPLFPPLRGMDIGRPKKK